MSQAFKDAVSLCKAILRNGFDAYIINPALTESLVTEEGASEIDIATDMGLSELGRLFKNVEASAEPGVTGAMTEGGITFRFYLADIIDASHPETTVARVTPRMLPHLAQKAEMASLACPYLPKAPDLHDGFADFSSGTIRLQGLPDETLRRNYLLGYRALRFAANYQLAIEPNSWMAIVRASQRMLDYVAISEVMDEWRKVEAENLWNFVQMLFDAQLLHGLIPEVAALSRVRHVKNESGREESVYEHTLAVMRHYPEELPFDWYGVMACLFHDVGKLFVAEFVDGRWVFYQHYRVGAKVTRKILHRLRFPPEEMDLICHLVRHNRHFSVMLTDKGIRRFRALDEYPRLIEMSRADIKAREGNYNAFNHNMKFLERADMPEEMLEPLLNGNEIMTHTRLKPGPVVGLIRDALLQAQIAGEVTNREEAIAFAKSYQAKEKIAVQDGVRPA
jgi:poly(A) polymerase